MGAAKKAPSARRKRVVASKVLPAVPLTVVKQEMTAVPLAVVKLEPVAALLMEADVKPTGRVAPVPLAVPQKRKQRRAESNPGPKTETGRRQ